jgi:hypothetical protein
MALQSKSVTPICYYATFTTHPCIIRAAGTQEVNFTNATAICCNIMSKTCVLKDTLAHTWFDSKDTLACHWFDLKKTLAFKRLISVYSFSSAPTGREGSNTIYWSPQKLIACCRGPDYIIMYHMFFHLYNQAI